MHDNVLRPSVIALRKLNSFTLHTNQFRYNYKKKQLLYD